MKRSGLELLKNRARREGETGKVREIPLEKLTENPFQPRFAMDEEELSELMASIERDGLLHPIAVVPTSDGQYMIVAGHRRAEAHRRLGKKRILANVLDKEQGDRAHLLALVENLNRSNLSPVEVAIAIERLLQEGVSVKEITRSLGESRTMVYMRRSVLKLDGEILADVRKRNTVKDVTVLYNLSKVKDPELQKRLYTEFIEGRLDRKALAKRVASLGKEEEGEASSASGGNKKPSVQSYQFSFAEGTRVTVVTPCVLKEKELAILNRLMREAMGRLCRDEVPDVDELLRMAGVLDQ